MFTNEKNGLKFRELFVTATLRENETRELEVAVFFIYLSINEK